MPPFVWWMTAVLAAQMVAWALVTPNREAPDESTHLDLVLYLAEGNRYPDYNALRRSEGITAFEMHRRITFALTALSDPDLDLAEMALPRDTRPTFDELGGSARGVRQRRNQMPQHPPLYYASASLVLQAQRALVGEQALEREQLTLRFVNAALLLPLPLLAWTAARRLRFGALVAGTAAALPAAVPQLHHVGASVSNDPLLVVLAAVAAVFVAATIADGPSRRRALKLGAVVGIALLVKGFGMILLGWVMLCYAALALWSPRWRRGSIICAAHTAVAAAVVGGWWWARNVVIHGTPAPTVSDQFFATRPQFEPDRLGFAGEATGRVARSFWGNFGWLDQPIPFPAVVVLSGLVGALVVVGLRRPFAGRSGAAGDGPGSPVSRRFLVAYLAILPMLLAYVLHTSWEIYARSSLFQFLQGRYLFTGLVPLAVATAVGAVVLARRRAPLAAVVVAGAACLIGWHTAFEGWWVGTGPVALRAADAWNPAFDGATYLAMALVVLAFAGAARSAWRVGVEARVPRTAAVHER